MKKLKKLRLYIVQRLSNSLKRLQLMPFGFRAVRTTTIAWSVSADGGGNNGRIIVGANSMLDKGVILRAYGNIISIGNNCTIHPYSIIQGGGEIRIGNGVRIAAHTSITASNHIYDDSSKMIYLQGESHVGIIIEDDVWIGAGARILDGVTVSKGTVIGAGAVITRTTEPYTVVVGNPGRVIKSRKNNA